MLIDVHCHLDFKGLKERIDEVVANAKKVEVNVIITSGINPETVSLLTMMKGGNGLTTKVRIFLGCAVADPSTRRPISSATIKLIDLKTALHKELG